jgi:hypothetical protein
MTADLGTMQGGLKITVRDGYEHRDQLKAMGGKFADLGPVGGKVWEIAYLVDRAKVNDKAYASDYAAKARADVAALEALGSQIVRRSDAMDVLRKIDKMTA